MKTLNGLIWIICILLVSTIVRADNIESLVMPGPVIEGHAKFESECKRCHTVFKKQRQNTLCLDCHKKVRKDLENRQGYHGRHTIIKTADCQICHIEHKGRAADIVKLDNRTFEHDLTDFKLKGAHKTVNCANCHKPGKKHREAPQACHNCHDNDPHKGKLGKQCQNCHNEQSWADITFDHDKTDFSLTGKHEKINCNSCHINNQYKNTPLTCNACHQVDDVHRGDNGKECKKCHNTRSWKVLKFDHDKDTKFKLLGRHKKVRCESCHPKNPYKVKVKTACIECHKVNDKHQGLYGDKCQQCHDTNQWSKIHFNHDKDTKYKLNGMHKTIRCRACHTETMGVQKMPLECHVCHKRDDVHQSTQHQQCDSCHNTVNWHDSIRFDHDLTDFPLLGLHAITSCDDCHLDKKFNQTTSDCYECHQNDDTHKLKLGKDCQQCHNPNGWNYWQFDHDKDTAFKLEGAHRKIHCHSCHQQPAAKGIETGQSCGTCHSADDVHNNQFGQQCDQCHNSEVWNRIIMLDL